MQSTCNAPYENFTSITGRKINDKKHCNEDYKCQFKGIQIFLGDICDQEISTTQVCAKRQWNWWPWCHLSGHV